jgi:hypothetical protein
VIGFTCQYGFRHPWWEAEGALVRTPAPLPAGRRALEATGAMVNQTSEYMTTIGCPANRIQQS